MRSFFLKHEQSFFALCMALDGATIALFAVAAIQANDCYALAGLICWAIALAILGYGVKLDGERVRHYREHAGHFPRSSREAID